MDRALARIKETDGQIKTHKETVITPLEREIQAMEEEGRMRAALLHVPASTLATHTGAGVETKG